MSLQFNTTPGQLSVGQGLKYVDASTTFTTSERSKTMAIDSQAGFSGGTFLGLTFNPTGLLTGTNPAAIASLVASIITDGDTIEGDGTAGDTIRLKKVYTDVALEGDGTAATPLDLVDRSAFVDAPAPWINPWIRADSKGITILQMGSKPYMTSWHQIQTIPNDTVTVVAADNLSASYNTGISADTAYMQNPVNSAGTYLVPFDCVIRASCWVEFNASATGTRFVQVNNNVNSGGNRIMGKQSLPGNASASQNAVCMSIEFVADSGSSVNFRVYQNSGSDMTNQIIHCSCSIVCNLDTSF